MAVFRKLYQPLLSCHYKFHTNFLLKQNELTKCIPNTRKIISLNTLITENADIYNNIKNENLLNIKWQSIRERFLQIQQITAATVDSLIIKTCLMDFQVDKAIAYFKFLRANNYPLNVGVIGNYLSLYVLKRDLLTEADKIEIINTYNALRKNHPYLDCDTAEHCVISLCLTDQWEKTDELIKFIKITTPTPSVKAYSAIADAAFRNGKSDVAWKALESIECLSNKQIPQDIVYKSHLQYCESEGIEEIFNSRMEEMFDFWAEHSMMPYNYIINAYADRATKYGWHTVPTTIYKTSCKYCGHSLSKITLSKNSFQELTESVMNKLIIGSDIYYKTNPQELQKFKKFIEKTKPYDIVIDGLNAFYTQKTSTVHKLEKLMKIVEHFNQQKKKILVVTRKHQMKLPNWEYIQQRAFVFYTNNMSADDVYMLYATMASGENAMFVSLDLFRQYKHSLKDLYLQQEFKKWQYSHQYFVRNKGKYFKIERPFVYLPTVQKNGDCWHIPYVSDNFTYADLYEFPSKWYCFKYDKKNK